jgi:hypothetical protein
VVKLLGLNPSSVKKALKGPIDVSQLSLFWLKRVPWGTLSYLVFCALGIKRKGRNGCRQIEGFRISPAHFWEDRDLRTWKEYAIVILRRGRWNISKCLERDWKIWRWALR